MILILLLWYSTALDAAGPLFESYPPSVRLDPSDAVFVDAIHTDGDEFYQLLLVEGGMYHHHTSSERIIYTE